MWESPTNETTLITSFHRSILYSEPQGHEILLCREEETVILFTRDLQGVDDSLNEVPFGFIKDISVFLQNLDAGARHG